MFPKIDLIWAAYPKRLAPLQWKFVFINSFYLSVSQSVSHKSVSFTVTHLPLQSGPRQSGWKDLHLCGYKLWSSPQRDCMESGCHCSKHIGMTPHEEHALLSKMMCLSSWMPGCSQSHHHSGILLPWAGKFRRKLRCKHLHREMGHLTQHYSPVPIWTLKRALLAVNISSAHTGQ